MADGLKSRTLRAVTWSLLERGGQQGMQFLIMVILARLLLPEEFGLIGMLALFMAVAQAFVNSGLGQALIQRKDPTHLDECSIFYFNILIGCLAGGLLCLAAPAIARFYDQPILVPLTRALSINLVVNAFGLVQTTLLTKNLDFKTQTKASMAATVLSGLIGVGMAARGWGVWSLVGQSLSANLFRTILLWMLSSWRPSLVFSVESLRNLFGFGSRLLAAGILETIFQNIYLLVIGKLFSPTSLGCYYQAQRIQRLPTQNLSSIIGRVAFPAFSSIHEDRLRLKRGMRKALTAMAFINLPMMIGLGVVADPLVRSLLTAKWLPAVPYLQLLCVVGLLYPLQAINLNVLLALGRSDLYFRLEILKKLLVVVAIAITYRWGIVAMIEGQICISLIGYYLNSYYAGSLIGYPLKEQVSDFLPYLATSVVMGALVYCLRFGPLGNSTALLLAQLAAGGLIYYLLCRGLRLAALSDVGEMLFVGRRVVRTSSDWHPDR